MMYMLFIFFLVIFFASFVSFLNGLSYRLTMDKPLGRVRSHCSSCDATISWYDLIPICSYIALKGHCRACKAPIHWAYLVNELITTLFFSLLFFRYMPAFSPTFFAYFIFGSCLCITFFSDAYNYTLLRFCTLFTIPCGLMAAALGFLPITFFDACVGCGTGYGILVLSNILYKKVRHADGLGNGDPELLAFIGSFVGFYGVVTVLGLAALIGSLAGLYVMLTKKDTSTKTLMLPFGPFLVLASFIWVLYQTELMNLLYHL